MGVILSLSSVPHPRREGTSWLPSQRATGESHVPVAHVQRKTADLFAFAILSSRLTAGARQAAIPPDTVTVRHIGSLHALNTRRALASMDEQYPPAENPVEWRRRRLAERRAQLQDTVQSLIQQSRTPLRDIVQEYVLPHLPVQSLLRFASVSSQWRQGISLSSFRFTQSYTHRTGSGVFCHMPPYCNVYFPFDPLAGGIPKPDLSFLPSFTDVIPLASSNGLLCCAGNGFFYVCNPSTTEWTSLPMPMELEGVPLEYDDRSVVALVFEPSVTNIEMDYHLVLTFMISGDCSGLFGFLVFSSQTGTWRMSSNICASETMICGSGVSAGGIAYWRTSMQTVVGYDPATDMCRTVSWPMGYAPTVDWQIGEMGGRLCCTCVTDRAVEVYALDARDNWKLLASYEIAEDDAAGGSKAMFQSRPRPLRFQSAASEVLLWLEGRLVGLDVAGQTMRHTPDYSSFEPSFIFVPHISTFAPVGRRDWTDGRRAVGNR